MQKSSDIQEHLQDNKNVDAAIPHKELVPPANVCIR